MEKNKSLVNIICEYVKTFFVKYGYAWKDGKPHEKIGMIADILQILTFGFIVYAFTTALELAYLTKLGKLFFAGIVTFIFSMIWIAAWQPVFRRAKGKGWCETVFSILFLASWVFLVPAISVGIYLNIGNTIDFLKTLR